MQSNSQLNLENISESGVPESRLNDAPEVLTLVKNLISADNRRSAVRAKVKGLIDGNPPYNGGELKRLGQSSRCNTNFRESESFLGIGLSAFYDVFSEAPTYATVRINHGDANDSETYSRIITEEFDRLQKKDDDFDYLIQLSQHEMVLYGVGPLMFEDSTDWRCKAIKAGDILVPEGTKSNVNDWSVCVVRARYQVHELYAFIRNEEAAAKMGWDVPSAKKAIMRAAPENVGGNSDTWEFHQQQLRNNDLSYSSRCDVVTAAHVFYREFPDDDNPKGGISHCIVDERSLDAKKFLFRKVRRFKKWQEAIHVLFYDKGDGTYHSVKGMGVKMFGAMEIKNRLRCALVDAAFMRAQILLQPTTPDATNKMGLVQMGPMAVLPNGFSVVTHNTPNVLDAPLTIERELEGLIQANTSQYRQRLEKQGNPRTATEIEAITAQQSTLGKTQLNRYYEQLDALFEERYRRAISSSLTPSMAGGAEAVEFQKRCIDRGCPRDCFDKIDYVRATRTVGRGSSFERKRTMQELLNISSMLPESGRANVIADNIASMVGYGNVDRYFPTQINDPNRQEAEQEAATENALFKLGAPIPVTDVDQHVAHAQSHLSFGVQAAQAAQQGGDIVEVAATLQTLLPHLGQHLQRLGADPSRKDVSALLEQQAKELAQVAKKIIAAAQQQAQAAAQQQAQMPPPDPNMMKVEREQTRKDAVAQADMARRDAKAKQEMALADAKTASAMRSGRQ